MKLFESLVIKGNVLKNRIVMATMCIYSSNHDGYVGCFDFTYYAFFLWLSINLFLQTRTWISNGVWFQD